MVPEFATNLTRRKDGNHHNERRHSDLLQGLSYDLTSVKDTTAAFSREAMREAHELNGPTFAHKILTTAELLTDAVLRDRQSKTNHN